MVELVMSSALHSQLIFACARLAQRLNVNTILCAWQEDEKHEDDFSRAMVATDDVCCAHPARRISPPWHPIKSLL